MSLFSEFKTNFYSRIGDGTIFDCGQINLLKVVLDGLRVRYAEKGPVHTPVFDSLSAHKRFLFLRRMKMRLNGSAGSAQKIADKLSRDSDREFLVLDLSGRFVVDAAGKKRSLYYDRLLQTLGRSRCFYVVDTNNALQFPFDLHFPAIRAWLVCQPLNENDKKLREELRKTYSVIDGSGVFSRTELANISAAFQLFFDYYRVWYRIADAIRPRTLIFEQHYHREGLAFAMKQLGIRTVELQHGLIAQQDIFYIFPGSVSAIIRRALFADRILVYGEFWKDRLLNGCEYPEKNIGVIGYYHYESDKTDDILRNTLLEFKGQNRLLLVTTQTSLHDFFIPYVQYLAQEITSNQLSWKIILKPHPAEKKGIYNSLESLGVVKIIDSNLEQLFPVADLHLSIYSTTIFDAIRFGVKSYALYVPEYGDYVDAMIEAGVATRTEVGVNFLATEGSSSGIVHKERFYSTFRPELFLSEMESSGIEK